MLNMSQFLSNPVAENEVTLNGAKFKVTDDVALKILSLCLGKDIEMNSGGEKTPVQVQSGKVGGITKAKTPYVATKDFKPQFEVKKQVSADGEQLFCISRKNGWTRAEKKMMNDSIKALKNIKEIQVQYTDKNGQSGSFKAWGYNTEATAKRHLKELPDIFTADQLNNAL